MLILAATPIGNLGDASRRLIEVLETAEIVAAEDTRTTLRLLRALGINNRPRLIALHDHNEKARAAEIVALAASGDLVVLSDAGMPTVSDPGYGLVAEAVAQGVTVTAIPGPSAAVTALAVSGMPTDRFTFEGFLPRKHAERLATLRALGREPRTMVFFESPARLGASLEDMGVAFGGERRAAVCRELSKLHEEVRRGTVAELAAWAAAGVRGEICIVVAGAPPRDFSLEDGVVQMQELLASGTRLKEAAAEVAAHTGLSARDLYQAVLASRRP